MKKLLDLIFRKKKVEEKVEVQEEGLPSKQLEEIDESRSYVLCERCKYAIYDYEPRKKISGQTFHRKCFKKMKREATKLTFG